MNYIGYNTTITDTFMNRSIAVNKVNGYNLYLHHDELGNYFLYTLKDEVVFGKMHTLTDCVGRTYGTFKCDDEFENWINMFAEYKEA